MTSIGYYNPFGYSSSTSHIFAFNPYDNTDDGNTSYLLGLRPVINLKGILKFTGDGTKNNPYVPSL